MPDYNNKTLHKIEFTSYKGRGVTTLSSPQAQAREENERSEALGIGESSGPPRPQLPPTTTMLQIRVKFLCLSVLPTNDHARFPPPCCPHLSIQNLERTKTSWRWKENQRRPHKNLKKTRTNTPELPKTPKNTTQKRRIKDPKSALLPSFYREGGASFAFNANVPFSI